MDIVQKKDNIKPQFFCAAILGSLALFLFSPSWGSNNENDNLSDYGGFLGNEIFQKIAGEVISENITMLKNMDENFDRDLAFDLVTDSLMKKRKEIAEKTKTKNAYLFGNRREEGNATDAYTPYSVDKYKK